MYTCQACSYTTSRKDAFIRHQTSNKHTRNVSHNTDHNSHNINIPPENVVPKPENVVPKPENVVPNQENVVPNQENVVPNQDFVPPSHQCQKCNKLYKTKEYLLSHEKTCTGIDSLTCPTCMKMFANRKTKSKHIKRNKCKPVSIFEAENVKSIINNNTNQSYNNNSLNTTNNNYTTNIYIHDYGKERVDYLLNYDYFYDIVRIPNNNILVKYLKCKNFNPKFPENHCIKYENRSFKVKENNCWRLINPSALKDKLFYDCGSEVLHVFQNHQDQIKKQMQNIEQFDAAKRKTNFIELVVEGYDKEIKNSMLDVVKDTT